MMSMQTLEMLEKKEKVLLKKAAGEVEKAKEFTRAKNRRGMIWSPMFYHVVKYPPMFEKLRMLSLCDSGKIINPISPFVEKVFRCRPP